MAPSADIIDVDAEEDDDEITPVYDTKSTGLHRPGRRPPSHLSTPSGTQRTKSKPFGTVNRQVSSVKPEDDFYDDPTDPTPDVHTLFAMYNKRHFDGQLTNVYVEFSTRMTLCAGTCTYRGVAGGCRIALSEPLLKLRPASDLRSTLLHEMIHAFLFGKGISRDGPDGHGPMFMNIAKRINQVEGPFIEITPYHTFNDEVDHYRTHHWRCKKCQKVIKRAMNRAPAPRDPFWPRHERDCGGEFIKVAEPPKKEKPAKRQRAKTATKPVVAVTMNAESGSKTQHVHNEKSLDADSGIERDNRNVVKTFRIDEMLGSSSARPLKKDPFRPSQRLPTPNIMSNNGPAFRKNVQCPVCTARVPESTLNSHLDECLAKDFANDVEECEVVANGKPNQNKVIDDEIIIASTPTPPSSSKRYRNDSALAGNHDAHRIPSPPSSPEIVVLNSTSAHNPSTHQPIHPQRRFTPIKSKSPPTQPSKRPFPSSSFNDTPRVDASRLMNFVLNPLSQKPSQLKEISNLIQSPSPAATKKVPSHTSAFSDIVRAPSPADYAKLARRKMKSASMPSSSSNFFSFATLARMHGTSGDLSGLFLSLVRHPEVTRAPNGSGFIIQPHLLEQLVTSRVRLDGNACRAPKRHKGSGTNQVSTDNRTPINVDIDSISKSKHTTSISRPRPQPPYGETNANRSTDADKDMNGNCPICDKSIIKHQLEAHVNACLADADLTKEFFTSEECNDTDRSEPQAKTEDPRCPICDQSVPRNQLEAHVESCITMSGLDNVF